MNAKTMNDPMGKAAGRAAGSGQDGPLRVAAYIRVSTDASDQENSYETQDRYFSGLLASNPSWENAGVYSDYGISGTTRKKRTGYNRILRHCAEGKIDRIVCKSISRFARNTADFMTALSILHENHVTIAFEKEGLDTADAASDFVLTTLAAIAQEESRSISENIRWSQSKRYPRGEVRNSDIYGYRYTGAFLTTEGGYRYREVEIVDEEAQVVRYVFERFLDGAGLEEIARDLNRRGIPARRTRYGRNRSGGKGRLKNHLDEGWIGEHVKQILQNERYCGDVRIQKTFTESYLNHRPRINRGEMPSYYVRDHHPAIVSRETVEQAQRLLRLNALRFGGEKNRAERYAFSGRIVCGCCGRFYNKRGHAYPVWFCPSASRNNGKRVCVNEKVYEEQLIRVLRCAIIDRFGLVAEAAIGDTRAADIMSGRGGEACAASLTARADSFVAQMCGRLEAMQRSDCMERDCGLLRRRLQTLDERIAQSDIRLRRLEAEYAAMKAGRALLGERRLTEAALQAQRALLDAESIRYGTYLSEREALGARLEDLEQYWAEVEADYRERENAIAWMKGLPEGRGGTVRFLNELTAGYVRAFVLSITIDDPLHYTLHWFDDTQTDVTLHANVEDFRAAADWWDGNRMRESCERRKKRSGTVWSCPDFYGKTAQMSLDEKGEFHESTSL